MARRRAKFIHDGSLTKFEKRNLSGHQSYPNLVPSLNKPNRLLKHIGEAFRLGRFSCVPTEHRLINVLLQVFIRHIVIAANNHYTEMTPKALYGIGEYVTINIFFLTMIDNFMGITKFFQTIVSTKFIGNHC